MRYTSKQYATALHQALEEIKPEDQDKVLDNFVAVLRQHGDLEKFAEIGEAFLEYEKTAKGLKLAEVTSARKLSGAEEEKIIRELNNYIGGRVELKKRIDEGLIGGIVVKIGDELIDGSIKKNLQELKSQLAE